MPITPYSGNVPNRSTQTQAEFSSNVDEYLSWFASVVPEYNALAVGSTSTGTWNAVEISNNGTASSPVLRFSSEPTSGLYRVSAGVIGMSILGSLKHRFSATDLQINGSTAYTMSNSVGTVSHDGTNNTGAVVETGTNANGTYTKFADGTMICHHDMNANSGADSSWTFPAAFISPPHIIGSSEAAFSNPRIFLSAAAPSATVATFNVVNLSSARTASKAYMTAMGRWRA